MLKIGNELRTQYQPTGESEMSIRAFKGAMGMLLLTTTFGAYAQGGGMPTSPAQASAIVARQANDKQLAASVLTAIAGSGVDNSKIKVRAYKGVVTLRGSVPTADQSTAASSAAATVQGVTTVRNRLKPCG
jgi:hyperosmotically inducible periplasmic protein